MRKIAKILGESGPLINFLYILFEQRKSLENIIIINPLGRREIKNILRKIIEIEEIVEPSYFFMHSINPEPISALNEQFRLLENST